MNTTLSFIVLAAFTLSPCLAQEKPPVDKKPLDASFLRLYAETRGFLLGRPVNPKITPDGKSVLFLRSEAKNPKRSLFEFDVASGNNKLLLTPEAILKGGSETLTAEEKARRERMRLSAGGFADFHLDESGQYILLPLSGKLFIFDRTKSTTRELKTGTGTPIDPKWSPDGKKIAYVLNHDVFIYDLVTDKESACTTGGTAKKTHGLAEFVAQEEMSRMTGYWWSPDSKFIAYEEADHDGVETWYVADATNPAQTPLAQYYPRPGKKNVHVRLGIVAVAGGITEPRPLGSGNTRWIEWDRSKYEYLASVRWDKLGPLTIQLLNRKQQELALLLVAPDTGKTTQLLVEKDPAFVNLRQDFPRWQTKGSTFVWVTEMHGAPALELHFADGKVASTLIDSTRGFSSLVRARIGDDLDPEELLYLRVDDTTRNSVSAIFSLVPRTPGSNAIVDKTPEPGMYSAVSSEKSNVLVISGTTKNKLPQTQVHHGGKTAALPSVALEPERSPNVEFRTLKGSQEYKAAIVHPSNFDPTKKYPVIVDVYGGPHHLHVTQSMRSWLIPQWLADQGFIVVAIENRGTPGRGRDWERAIYQKFGTVPLEDQVEGLQFMGKQFPELDLERVGIVGWSFGGYMSALAVLKRPDIYKAAVAGAPVTDWEDYDTCYTERYMGLLPESAKAYEESSLLPLAPKLSRPLLLVHGTADDNVYFRHTLRLTSALFRAGRDFEVLPLPGLTHMVPDPVVTERLWTRIAGHFQKHLGQPK
jgi:dipeptidyl-peptidase-4